MESGQEQITMINGLLDFIFLNVQRNSTKLKDYKVVPVPDLVKRLQINLFLTTLSASLTASQGMLSDLTTLKRVGDVMLTSQGNTLLVTAPIALDFLDLVFNHYTLQVAMIKKSGDKLRLNVKKTFFNALIILRFNGLECEIFFEKFKMLEFSDIDVEITGFSFLNPIARKVAEWVVDIFNNFIITEVAEEYARNLLNVALSDKNSLSRLVGYAISGMVESAKDGSRPEDVDNMQNMQLARRSEEDPVAPLRHRRTTASPVADAQNNQSCNSTSHQQNHLTPKPAQPSRTNNTRSKRFNQVGSLGPRTPEGSLRNDLRNNEIIIQPKSLFSSKHTSSLDVNHLPFKPPML